MKSGGILWRHHQNLMVIYQSLPWHYKDTVVVREFNRPQFFDGGLASSSFASFEPLLEIPMNQNLFDVYSLRKSTPKGVISKGSLKHPFNLIFQGRRRRCSRSERRYCLSTVNIIQKVQKTRGLDQIGESVVELLLSLQTREWTTGGKGGEMKKWRLSPWAQGIKKSNKTAIQ